MSEFDNNILYTNCHKHSWHEQLTPEYQKID